MPNFEETMMFKVENEEINDASIIIKKVCQALSEKGYNPINQLGRPFLL